MRASNKKMLQLFPAFVIRVAFWTSGLAIWLGWLLGYMAIWIPADSWLWWVQLPAILQPYIAVALMPWVLVLAFYRKWRWTFPGILALILSFGTRGDWNEPPLKPSEGDLRLATYNFAYDYTPDLPIQNPAASVSVNPDVWALQEVYAWRGVRIGGESKMLITEYADLFRKSFAHEAVMIPENPIMTVYGMPVLAGKRVVADTMRVFPAPARHLTEEPLYSRTVMQFQGSPFVLYNVHFATLGLLKPWDHDWRLFKSFGGPLFYLGQFATAYRKHGAQLRYLLNRIHQEKIPVVLAGDLNSTPNQWVYHEIAKVLQPVEVRREAWFTASWPTERPLFRIDHVWVSQAFEPVAYEVLSLPYSDHLPVLTYLRWRSHP